MASHAGGWSEGDRPGGRITGQRPSGVGGRLAPAAGSEFEDLGHGDEQPGE